MMFLLVLSICPHVCLRQLMLLLVMISGSKLVFLGKRFVILPNGHEIDDAKRKEKKDVSDLSFCLH